MEEGKCWETGKGERLNPNVLPLYSLTEPWQTLAVCTVRFNHHHGRKTSSVTMEIK